MISNAIFNEFKDLVYEKSGIALRPGKESLLEARIGKRMREIGLETPRDYLNYLDKDKEGHELVSFLDAISTNVTNFNREPIHFKIMEQIIKKWSRDGQTKFRIWSAACSTGQEPYTIAMTLADCLDLKNHDIKILATDISTRVLAKAKQGSYEIKEFGDIPRNWQSSYTLKSKGADRFEIDPTLKSLVTFARINLSTTPFPMSGPFDFVFCRNVMIYFDQEVRNKLVTDIHRLLRPGGVLFIGHSETLTNCPVKYATVKPSVYRKVGGNGSE